MVKKEENKPKIEIVSDIKVRDNKLAKGCLKLRFWAAEAKQNKLLIIYPKPDCFQNLDKINEKTIPKENLAKI